MSADYTNEIAQLEKIVNGSATSIVVDGLTVTYSLENAKQRLQLLKRLGGDTSAKPRTSSLNLGGAW